ncbi:MAG: 2-oxoacid:acceptor oxidoreductase subunit alpha [Methanotrichaceae archaeon]|nr:2-oxoacid:acceptor oxidoreductase subunit alpha [Methanotrichaceae archaeon]
MTNNFSILVGGAAGDGINEAGLTIGRLFNQYGYYVYMHYDYPSLVRGGHNFIILRASDQKIGAHQDKVDAVLALNQDTIDFHKSRWKDNTIIIYDLKKAKLDEQKRPSLGLPIAEILKEEGGLPVMQNTCIIGGLSKAIGIDLSVLESVLRKHIPKMLDQNLKVARRGYDSGQKYVNIIKLDRPSLPVLTGNQAIGMGLIKAGLKAYVAYPMTPSSSLLEFMARSAEEFGLKVVHPESEIAVMLMALGFAYAGIKSAVGTSGGGFCLMTEGLSLAGQAELPVVVMLGQRAGPSTGLPTYTAQGDLHFILNAGQGEFPRFIVAPGDAEEAYFWSGIALNMAWKYQVPAFILADKTVCEGLYSFDLSSAGDLEEETPVLWNGKGEYKRYIYTETGISPLAFPPIKDQVIKTNSYTHDEKGITSEDPMIAKDLAKKRLLKRSLMTKELESYDTVKVYGQGNISLLCWGSNRGVCIETADKFGLKLIQMLVLSPFPEKKFEEAMNGVDRTICVECNVTGQLARLLQQYGHHPNDQILRFDGRPFSLDDLEVELKELIR